MAIYASRDDELCCPLCGETNTHIDHVKIATRKLGEEDGALVEIGVSRTGEISDETDKIPVGQVGVGRRHRIALIGWCEYCNGEFALVFTQHKGVTLMESVDLERQVIDDAPDAA